MYGTYRQDVPLPCPGTYPTLPSPSTLCTTACTQITGTWLSRHAHDRTRFHPWPDGQKALMALPVDEGLKQQSYAHVQHGATSTILPETQPEPQPETQPDT